MQKIKLTVYTNRNYLAYFEFESGGETVALGASAMVHSGIPGGKNPAAGLYRLKKIVKIDPKRTDVIEAYGNAMIFFESVDPEKKAILAIHGGQPPNERDMIPTEGGVGLSNEDFEILLAHVMASGPDVELEVLEKNPGLFIMAGGQKLNTSLPPRRVQVSASRPVQSSSVAYHQFDDGITLEDLAFWAWLMNQDSSPDYPQYRYEGGGGEFGGGGATGSWDEGDQAVLPEILEPEAYPVEGEQPPLIVEPDFNQPLNPTGPAEDQQVQDGVYEERDQPPAENAGEEALSESAPEAEASSAEDPGTSY